GELNPTVTNRIHAFGQTTFHEAVKHAGYVCFAYQQKFTQLRKPAALFPVNGLVENHEHIEPGKAQTEPLQSASEVCGEGVVGEDQRKNRLDGVASNSD